MIYDKWWKLEVEIFYCCRYLHISCSRLMLFPLWKKEVVKRSQVKNRCQIEYFEGCDGPWLQVGICIDVSVLFNECNKGMWRLLITLAVVISWSTPVSFPLYTNSDTIQSQIDYLTSSDGWWLLVRVLYECGLHWFMIEVRLERICGTKMTSLLFFIPSYTLISFPLHKMKTRQHLS